MTSPAAPPAPTAPIEDDLRRSLPAEEEIVEEVRSGDGPPIGLVGRAADGSLVLTTAHAAFVEVELPAAESAPKLGWTLFAVMFGASGPGRRAAEPGPPPALRDWLAADAARGARLYRTATGFRYLLTAAPLDPASVESDLVLAALGADPRQRELCRQRRAYRVRLTPEPARCGASPPPADRAAFARWLRSYERKRAGWAASRFVAALGAAAVDPAIAAIVALHDARSDARSGLPLA